MRQLEIISISLAFLPHFPFRAGIDNNGVETTKVAPSAASLGVQGAMIKYMIF